MILYFLLIICYSRESLQEEIDYLGFKNSSKINIISFDWPSGLELKFQVDVLNQMEVLLNSMKKTEICKKLNNSNSQEFYETPFKVLRIRDQKYIDVSSPSKLQEYFNKNIHDIFSIKRLKLTSDLYHLEKFVNLYDKKLDITALYAVKLAGIKRLKQSETASMFSSSLIAKVNSISKKYGLEFRDDRTELRLENIVAIFLKCSEIHRSIIKTLNMDNIMRLKHINKVKEYIETDHGKAENTIEGNKPFPRRINYYVKGHTLYEIIDRWRFVNVSHNKLLYSGTQSNGQREIKDLEIEKDNDMNEFLKSLVFNSKANYKYSIDLYGDIEPCGNAIDSWSDYNFERYYYYLDMFKLKSNVTVINRSEFELATLQYFIRDIKVNHFLITNIIKIIAQEIQIEIGAFNTLYQKIFKNDKHIDYKKLYKERIILEQRLELDVKLTEDSNLKNLNKKETELYKSGVRFYLYYKAHYNYDDNFIIPEENHENNISIFEPKEWDLETRIEIAKATEDSDSND